MVFGSGAMWAGRGVMPPSLGRPTCRVWTRRIRGESGGRSKVIVAPSGGSPGNRMCQSFRFPAQAVHRLRPNARRSRPRPGDSARKGDRERSGARWLSGPRCHLGLNESKLGSFAGGERCRSLPILAGVLRNELLTVPRIGPFPFAAKNCEVQSSNSESRLSQ